MCEVEISQTVFVNAFFGDDATGQLNDLNAPFMTFDAAYAAVQALGPTRPSYILSLANGLYLLELSLYENISVTSTNNNPPLLPIIIIPEIYMEWDGVTMNNVQIFLIQTRTNPLRPELLIKGSSEITETSEISIENFPFDLNVQVNKSKLTKQLNSLPHTSKVEELMKRCRRIYITTGCPCQRTPFISFDEKRRLAQQTHNILGRTRFMIVNQASFINLAETQITVQEFAGDQTQIIGYLNDLNGDSISIVPNVDSRRVLISAVDTTHQSFFVNANFISQVNVSEEFYFTLINQAPTETDTELIQKNIDSNTPLQQMGFTETYNDSVERNIDSNHPLQQMGFTPAVLSLVEVSLGILGFIFTLPTIGVNVEKMAATQIIENEIARRITAMVRRRIDAIQLGINNRVDNDEPPIAAVLDSNLTSDNDIPITQGFDEYLYDGGNSSGILFPSNDLPEEIYPVINVDAKEGSNIDRGSQFTRYRVIKENYTHNPYDGEIFLIDASNNDITIIIPNIEAGIIWRGREMTYKRIDRSCHKVKIINQRGLFDNRTKKISLVSNTCNNCNQKWILPKVSFILTEEGNAYTL